MVYQNGKITAVSLVSRKNSSDAVHTITVIANPPEGGSVCGSGTTSDGVLATVVAEASEDGNYIFESWKENETVVSTQPKYNFSVMQDWNLTAEFVVSPYVAGVDWWNASLPSTEPYEDIAYGDGKFVAVINASTTKIVYTYDGIIWSVVYTTNKLTLKRIIYANGKFWAFGTSSGVLWSEDGLVWHYENVLGYSLSDVCYADSFFVGVVNTGGSHRGVLVSEDGTIWTRYNNLPSSAGWDYIAYGDGILVSLASGTSKAAVSYDGGINWIAVTLPISGSWGGIAYGDGKFVVSGGSTSKQAIYSSDGMNWDISNLPNTRDWGRVIYGHDRFIMVSRIASGGSYALQSLDGISWSKISLLKSDTWSGIAYGNRMFLVIGASNGHVAYSSPRGPNAIIQMD